MNGTIPLPSTNGHGPRTGYLYPPAEREEPVRSRRRWWPALEFAAMVALVAVLITSLATGGRFIPFRQGSDSTGGEIAHFSGGAVVNIPPTGGVPAEVMLRRLTFAPGASWESAPGLVVVTLVESGSLSFSAAKGATPASTVQAGSAYQADEASIVRNDGKETAVALQGVVSYAPAIESASVGVTEELLARHVTDSLVGGWTFVQLDRVSLAPSESIVDPVQGDTGFVRSGPAVTLAAVESGAVTLLGSGGQSGTGVTAGAAGAEAGVVTGSGGAGGQAEAEPIAGTAGEQPGFGSGGSDVDDRRTTDEVGGEVGSGGVSTSGGAGAFGGGAQTADEEPKGGANGAGSSDNVPEPDAGVEGEAKAFSGASAAITVTGGAGGATAGGISVTPDESATISRIVPASASGVVESSGTTEIRNTGAGQAVLAIMTLVPGFYETTDGAPPAGEAGAGGG